MGGMPSAGGVEVVRLREADWESHRELRLEMLLDSPDAYWTRHEDVVGRPEEAWRAAIRATPTLQARAADGTPVGSLTLVRTDLAPGAEGELPPGNALVVAVYVRPSARGQGVGNRLMHHAEQIARTDLGATRVVLHVHEHNAPALALYARHGYLPTGGALTHPERGGLRDLELAKDL